MKQATLVALALSLTTGIVGTAVAQARCGRDSVVSFGLADLDCVHCVVHLTAPRTSIVGNARVVDSSWVEYSTEPVVRAVLRQSSGANKLLAGDVILAIDGKLVTTLEGAALIGSPVNAKPTTFRVRRGTKQVEMTVIPSCMSKTAIRVVPTIQWSFGKNIGGSDSFVKRFVQIIRDTSLTRRRIPGDSAFTFAPTQSFWRRIPDDSSYRKTRFDSLYPEFSIVSSQRCRVPLRVDSLIGKYLNGRLTAVYQDQKNGVICSDTWDSLIVKTNASTGYLGFALDCTGCTLSDSAGARVWHFKSSPTVDIVAVPSSADSEGIRPGDILRAIDGMDMTTPAGANRFSTVKPGQRVTLTVERSGKRLEFVLTAGERGKTFKPAGGGK